MFPGSDNSSHGVLQTTESTLNGDQKHSKMYLNASKWDILDFLYEDKISVTIKVVIHLMNFYRNICVSRSFFLTIHR